MKVSFWLIAPLTIALLLSSCVPTDTTATPASSEAQPLVPTLTHPTFTHTPYDIATATFVPSLPSTPSPSQTSAAQPSPSLEPEQAKELIRSLLQEPVDCKAPCFWGIVPGQTTLGEAMNILTHLGLKIKSTTLNNKDFYGFKYDFDDGLSIIGTLTIIDEIVSNLRIDIDPEKQKAGVQREWLVFSPETMIQRYGPPSRVDLFLGRAAPQTSFSMDIYFDRVDTIIAYYIDDIGPNTRICPLRDQFTKVHLWMGKNPVSPPLSGEPLEKTSSLTLETFSELMMGDPNKACFNLEVEMFP